jgi:hypothetical protein
VGSLDVQVAALAAMPEFGLGTDLAHHTDVSANLAVATVQGTLRATVAFGANESSHLYRGAASPNPIGVVLRSPLEPQPSTSAILTIQTSDGESYECVALLHWSSPIDPLEHWLGFRLINPTRRLHEALLRLASRYPTRLYDECLVSPASNDVDEACPCTLRAPYGLADELAPPSESGAFFSVVDSSYRVDFDELRRSGPGMCLEPDEDRSAR